MVLLMPLKWFNQKLYYKIEGKFFHWLLSVVTMWSWSAGYDIVESGDDIAPCQEDGTRTLLLANHQSTADVPLFMACFNAKPDVLPNIMWIMDRVFKFTNFGIVSVLHRDFFVQAVSDNHNTHFEFPFNSKFLRYSFVYPSHRVEKLVMQPLKIWNCICVSRLYHWNDAGWFYSPRADSCVNASKWAKNMQQKIIYRF